MTDGPPTLLLAGPTAVGKTGLAVALAERFGLEIISADSMQVYRGMEIGTAQPTPEEAARARFHLCGVRDPAEPFSVREWLGLCDAAHADILSRGKLPLYVGGTGMYLRALRWGMFDLDEPTSGNRQSPIDTRQSVHRTQLEAELASIGPQALHERLAQVDPDAARRISPSDAVRIVRALEVHAMTGRPISRLQDQWESPRPRFPHVLIALVAERGALRERIARRTDEMLAAGWIDEARALLERGIPPTRHCFKALGYREIVEHLDGRLGLDRLRDLIVTRTGQFSKRQMIWLRRERPALWIEIDFADPGRAFGRVENILAKMIGRSV
ncbi:tRNA (adenosine(37)-N6)-dimethylallyltransferase MiaA [bacterium]|nr:tRNA (adenosine(37)-N6)-dimethylallyltransferase MiaA [bacterium]